MKYYIAIPGVITSVSLVTLFSLFIRGSAWTTSIKPNHNNSLQTIINKTQIDMGKTPYAETQILDIPVNMPRQPEGSNWCGLAAMQAIQGNHGIYLTQKDNFRYIMGINPSMDDILNLESPNVQDEGQRRRIIRRNELLQQRAMVDLSRDWSGYELLDGLIESGLQASLTYINGNATPEEFYESIITYLSPNEGDYRTNPFMFRMGNHWIVIDGIDVPKGVIRIQDSLGQPSVLPGYCRPREISMARFYEIARHCVEGENPLFREWELIRVERTR